MNDGVGKPRPVAAGPAVVVGIVGGKRQGAAALVQDVTVGARPLSVRFYTIFFAWYPSFRLPLAGEFLRLRDLRRCHLGGYGVTGGGGLPAASLPPKLGIVRQQG